jgi:hypothetical protein
MHYDDLPRPPLPNGVWCPPQVKEKFTQTGGYQYFFPDANQQPTNDPNYIQPSQPYANKNTRAEDITGHNEINTSITPVNRPIPPMHRRYRELFRNEVENDLVYHGL